MKSRPITNSRQYAKNLVCLGEMVNFHLGMEIDNSCTFGPELATLGSFQKNQKVVFPRTNKFFRILTTFSDWPGGILFKAPKLFTF